VPSSPAFGRSPQPSELHFRLHLQASSSSGYLLGFWCARRIKSLSQAVILDLNDL
jgi:hypothetical protein